MGLAGRDERMHPALLRKVIAFPGITGAARSDHVRPLVVAPPRERHQVIPGETLTVPQVDLPPMTVLAAVAIASEEEGVGDLAAESAGNVDELDETDDRRFGKCQPFAANALPRVCLDDLGLPLDDQTQGAPHGHHGEGFERGVQRQTTHAFLRMATEQWMHESESACPRPGSALTSGFGDTWSPRRHPFQS